MVQSYDRGHKEETSVIILGYFFILLHKRMLCMSLEEPQQDE